MLEIIALIFLTKEIGNLAASKGLKAGRWKLYLILTWFCAEIVGLIAGLLIFGIGNLISAMLVGLAFAVTPYFIIKSNLSKKPDVLEDDINSIGSDKSY